MVRRRHGPAHLDVVANLIVTEAGLRLIDFEYAASADPARELGQVVWEAELDRAAAGRLVQAYDPNGGVAETATDAVGLGHRRHLDGLGVCRRRPVEPAALRARSWERLQSHWAVPGA